MQFDEFLSVIDLLKNPDKYAAQIAELNERQASIEESIKTLGVVGDIAKARTKVQAQLDKAEATIQEAKEQAERIVADAGKVYEKKFAELKEREVSADQAIANYNAIKSQFTSRDNELRQAEKATAILQAQLEQARADLAAKQAEVDARLAKLREAMG